MKTERARCQVRASSATNSTTAPPPLSIVGEVSSSYLEPAHADDGGAVEGVHEAFSLKGTGK